jgi:hypothetical protein
VDVRHDTASKSRVEYRDTRADSRSNTALVIAMGSVLLTAVLIVINLVLHH